MQVRLELDKAAIDRAFSHLGGDLKFGASVALNRTADDAQTAIRDTLPGRFTLRRPDFILRTIYRQPGLDFASKTKLEAGVRIHPERNYLAKFEAGGRKLPRGPSLLSIPLKGVRPGAGDVVPRSQRAGRIIDRKTVFRYGKFIYRRVGRGRSSSLVKLYYLVPVVPIPASLHFVETARNTFDRRWPENMTGVANKLLSDTFSYGKGR